MIATSAKATAFYCRYRPGQHPNYAEYIIPATSKRLDPELRMAFLRRARKVLATGEPVTLRLQASGRVWDVEIAYHRADTVGTTWRLVTSRQTSQDMDEKAETAACCGLQVI